MFKMKCEDIFQKDNYIKHKLKLTERSNKKVVWVFGRWRGEHMKRERSVHSCSEDMKESGSNYKGKKGGTYKLHTCNNITI